MKMATRSAPRLGPMLLLLACSALGVASQTVIPPSPVYPLGYQYEAQMMKSTSAQATWGMGLGIAGVLLASTGFILQIWKHKVDGHFFTSEKKSNLRLRYADVLQHGIVLRMYRAKHGQKWVQHFHDRQPFSGARKAQLEALQRKAEQLYESRGEIMPEADRRRQEALEQLQEEALRELERVEIARLTMGAFWDANAELYESYPQKRGGANNDRQEEWLRKWQEYRLLVEPIDIATWYGSEQHLVWGHYLANGNRPRRWRVQEELWRAAHGADAAPAPCSLSFAAQFMTAAGKAELDGSLSRCLR